MGQPTAGGRFREEGILGGRPGKRPGNNLVGWQAAWPDGGTGLFVCIHYSMRTVSVGLIQSRGLQVLGTWATDVAWPEKGRRVTFPVRRFLNSARLAPRLPEFGGGRPNFFWSGDPFVDVGIAGAGGFRAGRVLTTVRKGGTNPLALRRSPPGMRGGWAPSFPAKARH